MDYLEYYKSIILAENAGLIFLCICGAILNGAMLYVLSTKKQIRASVYTAYMIQIALTDLLVCAVWLVLTCVLTAELHQSQATIPTDYVPNETEENDIGNNSLPTFEHVFSPSQTGDGSMDSSSDADRDTRFTIWRVLYTVYNFHYYTNIFLLASMSVERCAAVWKSLRCQRYQYNRKSIYTVSICVWILSLACVLPSFINLDLVVSEGDNSQALRWTITPIKATPAPMAWGEMEDPLTHIFEDPQGIADDQSLNFTTMDKEFKEGNSPGAKINLDTPNEQYRTDMEILYECYLLLWRARQLNKDCVTDYRDISMTECLHIIGVIISDASYGSSYEGSEGDYYTGDTYNPEAYNGEPYNYPPEYNFLADSDETNMPSNDGTFWSAPDTGLPPVLQTNNDTGMCIRRDFYLHLLVEAVQVLVKHYKGQDANEAKCDPMLSDSARAYVISVNLIIGFFIPFVIIVVSYVSIAYMIGKRANSRMKPDIAEGGHQHGHYNFNYNSGNSTTKPNNSDTFGRKMTTFLRYVMGNSYASEDKSYWEETGDEPGSIVTNKNQRSPPTLPSTSGINGKSISNDKDKKTAIHSKKNDSNTSLTFPSIQRTKKYSFGHDVEHIPQTIAEHPHESDESADANYVVSPQQAAEGHAQRASYTPPNRRESGGSYTSSVESFPTEQTSVTDKRLSASTTSALTPPTPLNHIHSPNVNEFFLTDDGKKPEHESLLSKDENNEQNLYEKSNISRPRIGRFFSAPDQSEPAAEAELQLITNNSTQGNKKSNDFAHKIFHRYTLKKKTSEFEESTFNGNDSSEFIAKNKQQKILPSEQLNKYQTNKMVRSQSAPERENRRINNGSGMSSFKRGVDSTEAYSRYKRQTSTSSFYNFIRGRANSNTSSKSGGNNTMRKTVVRKNAERHLRVSRTVLAYVIVFAVCWLPQRIVYLLYVVDGLMDQSFGTCLNLLSVTRVISFITVLLNPIVYVVTQRELRSYMKQRFRKSQFMKLCCGISKRFKRKTNANVDPTSRENGTSTINQNNREEAIFNNISSGQPLVSIPSLKPMQQKPPTIMRKEDEVNTPLFKKLKFNEEELKKQDEENKNWIERSIDSDNHKSTNNSSKTSNSSSGKEDFFFSKSENIEEFWMRWLQEKQYATVNQQEDDGENSSSAAAKVLAKMSQDMNETTI